VSKRACQICGNRAHNRCFSAREMMFGLRDSFAYLECGSCGCLQLLDVPDDLSRFYPRRYYSLGQAPAVPGSSLAKAKAKAMRARALLRMPAAVIEALVHAWWLPALLVPTEFMWLTGFGLTARSSVADLGSGNGEVLAWMLEQGFSNLAGFDPFLANDLQIAGQITIRARGLDALPDRWDLIMLNHSFEHMPAPADVLRGLRARLNEAGSVLIRMPVADSWAARTYGPDWAQLDAPRHLFIHTRRSMAVLAEQAGMAVTRVFFDSGPFQFWGSELYRKDIPLRDPRSPYEDPRPTLFSRAEMRRFHRRAQRLNREGRGDSAGFVLRDRARLVTSHA
jgi:SAM-dependent methyltransferase